MHANACLDLRTNGNVAFATSEKIAARSEHISVAGKHALHCRCLHNSTLFCCRKHGRFASVVITCSDAKSRAYVLQHAQCTLLSRPFLALLLLLASFTTICSVLPFLELRKISVFLTVLSVLLLLLYFAGL